MQELIYYDYKNLNIIVSNVNMAVIIFDLKAVILCWCTIQCNVIYFFDMQQ